jgi:anti-sigma regulatory factor (Ser/Thr protein kinase)
MTKEKEISFYRNFIADTSIVGEIGKELTDDLLKMEYQEEETGEIVLAMDECIANAVKATIENTNKNSKKLYITVRYGISETEFDATIIDNGAGLEFIKTLNITPDSKSDDYHNQVTNYAANIEKTGSTLKMNNQPVSLKGVGAGLKIILSFMDSVFIEYIDKKEVIASNVSESTDGTIISMKRKRRIFNSEDNL